MEGPDFYLHITDDPLLSKCRGWVKRMIAYRKAMMKMAKSLGSDGIYTSGFDHGFAGLRPLKDGRLPEGWRLIKPRGRHGAFLYPLKGAKGLVARELVAALPTLPSPHEAAGWISHPASISWEANGGKQEGFRSVGSFFPVSLFFPSGEGPFFLRVADPQHVIKEIRKSYPKAVITTPEWAPPTDGVERISKEAVDFLIAKANLEATQRKVA